MSGKNKEYYNPFKEWEEDPNFDGCYAWTPEGVEREPVTHNFGAMVRYMKANNKEFLDLTQEEIDMFKIDNVVAKDGEWVILNQKGEDNGKR